MVIGQRCTGSFELSFDEIDFGSISLKVSFSSSIVSLVRTKRQEKYKKTSMWDLRQTSWKVPIHCQIKDVLSEVPLRPKSSRSLTRTASNNQTQNSASQLIGTASTLKFLQNPELNSFNPKPNNLPIAVVLSVTDGHNHRIKSTEGAQRLHGSNPTRKSESVEIEFFKSRLSPMPPYALEGGCDSCDQPSLYTGEVLQSQ